MARMIMRKTIKREPNLDDLADHKLLELVQGKESRCLLVEPMALLDNESADKDEDEADTGVDV